MQQVNCHVENLLRYQSHPNFIRWSTGNGNKPRVVFAIVLGVFLIAVGTLTALLITLGTAGRGYRALGAIGWMTGTATLFGGLKGMFVVLHGRHRRNLRPWELWGDGESKGSKDSFETEISSNSYENEVCL